MSDPKVKNVTIRYDGTQWTFSEMHVTVELSDTYLKFKLEAAGFRFADPVNHPGEPLAVEILDPSDGMFRGPWTLGPNSASLLDLKPPSTTPVNFRYLVQVVQSATGEVQAVPSSQSSQPYPVIANV